MSKFDMPLPHFSFFFGSLSRRVGWDRFALVAFHVRPWDLGLDFESMLAREDAL